MVAITPRSLEAADSSLAITDGKDRGAPRGLDMQEVEKDLNSTRCHWEKNRWVTNRVLFNIYKQKKARMEEQESEGSCLNKKASFLLSSQI